MYFFAIFLTLTQICHGQMVETNPVLLDSFVPAAMQIIAHITELMKFDIKPDSGTTSTTVRPTRPHKPGIYQPELPPGPDAYFAKAHTYEEYVERLRGPTGYNYFERYRFPIEGRSLGEVPIGLRLAFGTSLNDLLERVFRIEEINQNGISDFVEVYDDSGFYRSVMLRGKKQPPTRAYVSLLSLYDMLNKESKKLGLNKFTGYASGILQQLAEISTGTSAMQLKSVLSKIMERQDVKNPQILKRITELVKDLEESSSYISSALRYIPPLPFEV